MKTRSKIASLLAAVFFGLILAFSIFIYVFNSRYAFADFYKRLEIRSFTTAKSELDQKSSADLIREFKGEYLEPLHEEQHLIIPLEKNESEEELAKKFNMDTEFLANIIHNDIANYRKNKVFYSGIKYRASGKDYLVITSAINYYYDHHMAYLRNLLIISVFVSILIVILISYWLSLRLFNPIKVITEEVNRIGSENLFVRLEDPKSEDELAELVRTFNDMLDRLETSFETQNNFISNASHELNTPLTSIIGEADVALARERDIDEYKDALQNILSEAEKLDKKTKALLYLAQTGFNGKTIKFDKVRVDQLILDVHHTIGKIHPDNKITIDFSDLPDSPEKLKVKGNEQLLHLALSNVLLNSYKYSNNKPVHVSLEHDCSFITITVKDDGIGIPKTDLQYIYDPFFRASNTGNFEGYGIGLPLTRNIIKLHHGEMVVSSKEKEGTTVEIRIPIGGYTL
jgi:signal transduction histidine kinase